MLTIYWINHGLIADCVCADFVAVIGVLLNCLFVEEYI